MTYSIEQHVVPCLTMVLFFWGRVGDPNQHEDIWMPPIQKVFLQGHTPIKTVILAGSWPAMSNMGVLSRIVRSDHVFGEGARVRHQCVSHWITSEAQTSLSCPRVPSVQGMFLCSGEGIRCHCSALAARGNCLCFGYHAHTLK